MGQSRVYDEGPSRKDGLPENRRSNVTTKDALPPCQLIVGMYTTPFIIDVNRTHVKDEGNHTPSLSRNRGRLGLFQARILKYDDRASSHLDSLQGRDWVNQCDAEYTSVWEIWPSTVTEMSSNTSGKLCTNYLKEVSAYTRRRW